jgi:hypothetical protein
MEKWVGIEDDPAIQEAEIEEVLKELEVGKEKGIDDDANGGREDPMVVDDSDSDDDNNDDDSLGFKSHLEIELAFRKALSFAKKKRYPKKLQDLIDKSTKEITKAMRAHRLTKPKGSPSITAFFKPVSAKKT